VDAWGRRLEDVDSDERDEQGWERSIEETYRDERERERERESLYLCDLRERVYLRNC
jgi:hypothetical protein